jgi:UDPglucose 6-dehydrogenase
MNIAVVGTGYVGLVTGACLADAGHSVVCIDKDRLKIENLKKGILPIYEPGLEDVVARTFASGALTYATSIKEGIANAEVIYLCVGTPPKANGAADLSFVFSASEEIGENLDHYAVIVSKSTVPVGTSGRVKKIIAEECSVEFDVASNPEFLREGTAVSDFQNPDRIVFGTESEKACKLLLKTYSTFSCEKVATNIESSEMTKYASNAFLATKLSFINEIAQVCEAVGADIEEVAYGMGLDSRIGPKFLNAGLGYGGSCFPKDVRALHQTAGANGYPFQLLRSVIEVNNNVRWLFYKKIQQVLGGLDGKRIAVWGLSFKPNTDDIRDSIAVELISRMQEDGADVIAFDPVAGENVKKDYPHIMQAVSALEAAKNADAVVVVTEWSEFAEINLDELAVSMHSPVIFDGRNIFDPTKAKEAGFTYYSIGRAPVSIGGAVEMRSEVSHISL